MRTLLEKFKNDNLLEKLEDKLKEPNIFSILKMESYEIRHSNFIAWLLDPNESHNLGHSFLKPFLEDIFSENKVDFIKNYYIDEYISKIELQNIKILREYYNIDLLVISDEFVICIENKIFAQEHSDQLSKYTKTLEEVFKDKKHIFIFLTPLGNSAKKEENSNIYISYSYRKIKKNIEAIIDNNDKIDQKVRFYIEDYLSNLGKNIMNDSEEIKLVQEIYKKHKKALDFIFKKKEDLISKIISESVKEKGYVLGTQSKGYCKFLKVTIKEIIENKNNTWTSSESFAFEIDYSNNTPKFKVVVLVSNEKIRKILSDILEKIEGINENRNKTFRIHYTDTTSIANFSDEKYILNDDLVKTEIHSLLNKNEELIKKIEMAILGRKDDFINL